VGKEISSNWQGIINTYITVEKYKMKMDRKYLLELSFSDPHFDYLARKKEFKKDVEEKFVLKEKLGESLGGLSGFDTRAEFPSFGNRMGWNGRTEYSFEQIEKILEEAKNTLDSLFTFKNWPPFYSKVCDRTQKKCRDAGSNNHVVLRAIFSPKSLEGKDYTIEDIYLDRTSTLLPKKRKKIDKQPEVVCVQVQ